MSTIWVVAKKGADKKAHDRVVLWEVNDKHPEGECWVVRDGKPVQVAKTDKVKELLAFGELEEVATPKLPESKPSIFAVQDEAEPEEEEEQPKVEKPVIPGINRGGRPPKK